MDQERTMQFILDNLASVTAKLDTVADQTKALAARQDKTDRQIHGLQNLVKTGMKLILKLGEGQKDLQKELRHGHKQLQAAQKKTDEKFDLWLDSMKKGSNGHKK